MLFVCTDLGVAICRATISGCSETNPASGIGTAVASLRYRIEMEGKLVVDQSGTTRGSFPTDYDPAKCVIHWE